MNPKIKLKVSINADIENAKWFVENGVFLDMFLPEKLFYIMDEKLLKVEKNKIIAEYTKQEYFEKKKEIEFGVKKIEKDWKKIENKFFKVVGEIFKSHPWPKGKYVGYASVFLMFPRDIEEKVFYFPYNEEKWNPLRTIAHEMLHFIFFDYIENKYNVKENDKLKGRNPEYVWQVSEAFNFVIENWKPYADIFNAKEKSEPYDAGCKKVYDVMKKQWTNEQDVDSLLDKWFLKL